MNVIAFIQATQQQNKVIFALSFLQMYLFKNALDN